MRNIVDEIKDTYNKIEVTDEVRQKVFNNTIYSKPKRNTFRKLVLTLGSIVGVCAISLSVVYADEIKEYLASWRAVYSFSNHDDAVLDNESYSYKEIKDDTFNTHNEGLLLNYKEVEESLGFKILKSKLQTSEEIYYTTFLNNDNKTIASVNLWMPDFIKNENYDLSLSANFLTTNADEGYKMTTIDDTTGAIKKYVGKDKTNFDSAVIFYTISQLKEGESFMDKHYEIDDLLCADFIYDGIKYRFTSNEKITQKELLKIINDLNY